MSFRFGFRRPKAATPFDILMLRAAKPPISAPSAAASRRLRSETRLRAQSAEDLPAAKRSNAAKAVRPRRAVGQDVKMANRNLKYQIVVLCQKNRYFRKKTAVFHNFLLAFPNQVAMRFPHDHSFNHRQRKHGPPEMRCLRRPICVLCRIALVNLPVPSVFPVLSRRRSPPSSPGSTRPASSRTRPLFSHTRSGTCACR